MKCFKISNRRYLGNKFRLLEWIKLVVDENCGSYDSFFDVFSGTGSVASAFIDKRLVVNDMLYSNYLAGLCWFSPEIISINKIKDIIYSYNEYDASKEDNYFSRNFSDTYFDGPTCKKIGFIREDIQQKYESGLINKREFASLVTSLFYAMDKISHTCGHYDSFIQDGNYVGMLELCYPKNDYILNPNNLVLCSDSNLIADQIEADVAYLDPPYNSRQYCDAYHLLENIARWEKPQVYGIAKKMDRSHLKSKYCKEKEAVEAMKDLVKKLHCKYIVLSYNNNGKKLQCRSNAKLSDDKIIEILSMRGDVQVFTIDHRGFNAGKGTLNKDNKERLFICNVHN